MKRLFLFFYLSVMSIAAFAAEQFVVFTPTDNHFPLISQGVPCPVYVDPSENKGVLIAVDNLRQDILQICGTKPESLTSAKAKRCVIVGTYNTPFVKKLIAANKIDKKELEGKNEKYILQVVTNPCEGVDEAVVIIGSDRRGTIYGIYELSEQMGGISLVLVGRRPYPKATECICKAGTVYRRRTCGDLPRYLPE